MFEFDAKWDVDKAAESLNNSLFGKSKKHKAREASVPVSNDRGNKFYSSVIPDSDDEQYSKRDKKKLKKRRKKNKVDGQTGEKDSTNVHQSYVIDSVAAASKKSMKSGGRSVEVPKQKLKVNTSLKSDSGVANVKNKKVKKEMKIQENNTIPPDDKLREKNSRKRKRSPSASSDNMVSKNKMAKVEKNIGTTVSKDDVSASEDGRKKRKRNRKKKNNSKKNKYKHLALNSKQNTGDFDISKGSESVNASTKKELINNKANQVLKPNSSKSSEYIRDSQNISSQKACIAVPTKVQQEDINKSNHYNGADGNSLSENKSKKRRKNSKHSTSHNENPKSELESPMKKIKGDKNNSKDDASARSSQPQPVRKASDPEKLSSPKVSLKNKLKQQVLLKMLSEAQVNKQDKTNETSNINLTSDKKKRKKHGVTPVPNGSDSSDFGTPDKQLTRGHKFKNSAETVGKPGNISGAIDKKSTVSTSPVSQSIWGKAAELGQQAKEKLNSAQFRYINEQLYSCTGGEAMKLFKQAQDTFSVYHEGFQSQVSKWPVNPLDVFVKQIRDKPKNLVIADFGCGDAKLAESVPQKVHSFDLVALNNRVIACDMSKTPLPSEQVDIAVFCLSLMGTNISDYIQEANRVLKTGGLLKIAEVVSRFSGLSRFTDGVCSYGFQLLNKRDLHQMFYLLDFKKIKTVKKSASLREIKLKPCIYKRR